MSLSKSTVQIRIAIKALLKRNHLKYADMAAGLGVSEGAIKQLMTRGSLTIDKIESIAHFFNLSFFEFMQVTAKHDLKPHPLNHNQESILLKAPVAVHILFQLSAGFSVEQIESRSKMSQQSFYKALLVLEKANLIDLHGTRQVRLKANGPYKLVQNGPIENRFRSIYLKKLALEVTRHPAEDTLQKTFELYLSKKSLQQLQQEVIELATKYSRVSRIEIQVKESHELSPVNALFLIKPFDLWGQVLSEKRG